MGGKALRAAAGFLGRLLGPRQRDAIGYLSDPDRREEDWTPGEIGAEFARQVGLGFPVGLRLIGDYSWAIRALDAAGAPPRPVAVQADTGPLGSFKGPFRPDPDLLRLACSGKIRLFFHLPHLFDLWLPFDESQIRWRGELVKVPLVRACVEYLNDFAALVPEGLDADIGFVLHANYPRWPGSPGKDGGPYAPAGKSADDEARELRLRFRNNLAWLFDPFIGGLSRRGVRGRVLLENMAGSGGRPEQMSTFEKCRELARGLDRSRYGLCWDLLHSWAAGEALSPADFDPSEVGLIHMNGGPACAAFGSGRDLHGYAELRAAAGRRSAYPWIADAALAEAPAVFERELYSIMLKDSAWLAQMRGIGDPAR